MEDGKSSNLYYIKYRKTYMKIYRKIFVYVFLLFVLENNNLLTLNIKLKQKNQER